MRVVTGDLRAPLTLSTSKTPRCNSPGPSLICINVYLFINICINLPPGVELRIWNKRARGFCLRCASKGLLIILLLRIRRGEGSCFSHRFVLTNRWSYSKSEIWREGEKVFGKGLGHCEAQQRVSLSTFPVGSRALRYGRWAVVLRNGLR